MKRIRVSAINGVAKKAALGAMLFSSVVMFATTPNRNTRTENPPQAEVVSREGADALKAITFPGFQQNPTVPTVHNQKLDENFLKFCNTPEEKKMVTEFIDNIYKENGSYLGSATIQQNIDLNMFLEFLNGNIEILKNFEGEYHLKNSKYDGLAYYDAARMCYDEKTKAKLADLNNKVGKWVEENYFSIYSDAFKTDHPLDYDETLQMFKNSLITLDNCEFSPGKNMFSTFTLRSKYNKAANEIHKNSANDIQKTTYIFANMMNATDADLFWNLCQLYYDPPYNDNMFELLRIFNQAVWP